jgi:hypothetical protein
VADRLEIIAAGAFLGLVGYALADGFDFTPRPTAYLKGGCKTAPDASTALAVANKWGPVFGCPVQTLMIIGAIESGYRQGCSEVSPRAMARGGAFGMWQQTLNTARGHARELAGYPDPDVQTTLRKWRGIGSDLYDPDLCGMFAARQLGQLTAEFGDDIALVAGGYHQGAGKIRSMLAAGRAIPAELPPHGKTYVTRALETAQKIG